MTARLLTASLLVALVAVGSTHTAEAGEWELAAELGDDFYLSHLSAPTQTDVLIAGFSMNMAGGMLPVIECQVLASTDSGETFNAVGAPTISGLGGFCIPSAFDFGDTQIGLLAVEETLFRTVDGGASWSSSDVGFPVQDIHFFDSQRVVLVGEGGGVQASADGGASWASMTSAGSDALSDMFWLDAQRGWVASSNVRVEVDSESGREKEWAESLVVYATTDGGQSWSASANLGPYLAGPMTFLADGQTGWFAVWEQEDEDRTNALLFKTTDGGATFTNMNVPTEVATLDMFGSHPLLASTVAVLRFDDADHGHLGGSVFVTKYTSGSMGGGSDTYIYRTVDFVTHDGGQTWIKSDLGSITFSMTSPDSTPNDGATLDGALVGLYQGWMVGEGGRVWRYDHYCEADTECAAGSVCILGLCQSTTPAGCSPACETGFACDNGTCVPQGSTDNTLLDTSDPDAAGSDTVGMPGSDTATGDPIDFGDTGSGSGSDDGCGCTLSHRAPAPLTGVVAFAALLGAALVVRGRRF